VEELNVDEFMDVGLLDEVEDDDDEDDPAVLETGSVREGEAEAAADSDAASEAEEEEEDGEDEDPEAAERRLLAEIDEHEQEMRALAKSDPAFYRHLQENDAELLHFNKEDVLRAGQRQADDDQEDEPGDDKKAGKKAAKQAAQTGQHP
jgi:nucleolar complex protein 2